VPSPFAPLDFSQISAAKRPFWEQTAEDFWRQSGPDSFYPWTQQEGDEEDAALATVGQLKTVFSFELPTVVYHDLDPRLDTAAAARLFGELTLGYYRDAVVDHTNSNFEFSSAPSSPGQAAFRETVEQSPGFVYPPGADPHASDTFHYDLYHPILPQDTKAPLIIMLHGGGGGSATAVRGNSNSSSYLGFVAQGQFRCHLLLPRSIRGTIEHTNSVVSQLLLRNDVDPDRVYLTGFSAGGFFTRQVILQEPDRYAAALVSGGYPVVRDTDPESEKEAIGKVAFSMFLSDGDSSEGSIGFLNDWHRILTSYNPATRVLYVKGGHATGQRLATSRHTNLRWLLSHKRLN